MVHANCLLSEQFLNGLCSNYWSVPSSTCPWPLKFGQDYCATSQEPAYLTHNQFSLPRYSFGWRWQCCNLSQLHMGEGRVHPEGTSAAIWRCSCSFLNYLNTSRVLSTLPKPPTWSLACVDAMLRPEQPVNEAIFSQLAESFEWHDVAKMYTSCVLPRRGNRTPSPAKYFTYLDTGGQECFLNTSIK